MALENLLSQVGLGPKQLTDRYSGEYGVPPVQDQHVYYSYESSQPSHGHSISTSSKHHHSGGGGLKSNASMSALTLLAFLFFLHILQQCLKDHMTEMTNTPVVVMSASRESVDALQKTASKVDKTGVTQEKEIHATNPYKSKVEADDKMMRINAAEHQPKRKGNVYEMYKKDAESSFQGFVSAMDDD